VTSPAGGAPGTRVESTTPPLHVVTDDAVVARSDWLSIARRLMEVCGDAIALHVRAPGSGGAQFFRLVIDLEPIARRTGSRLVVNDRIDVALAAGVDAVHLGARSLDVATARSLMGESAVIGRSCHSAAELSSARDEGADYAFAGTVFATPSHRGREGIGVAEVTSIAAAVPGFPVIGIGGIGVDDVVQMMAAGAAGVAIMRGVWDAPDPVGAVTEYISALRMPVSD